MNHTELSKQREALRALEDCRIYATRIRRWLSVLVPIFVSCVIATAYCVDNFEELGAAIRHALLTVGILFGFVSLVVSVCLIVDLGDANDRKRRAQRDYDDTFVL